MTQLNDLPLEILYLIFDHLTPEDLGKLVITSANFYIEDNKLEQIVEWVTCRTLATLLFAHPLSDILMFIKKNT